MEDKILLNNEDKILLNFEKNNLSLNPSQLKAVKHFEGPMLVLAGPGSGKTTVIASRVKYLIDEYKVLPKDIAVITFARNAASEMKERFFNLSNNTYANEVMFGTFHSFFYKILRTRYNYSVSDTLNEYERRDIVRKALFSKRISASANESALGEVLNEISFVKNELCDISGYKPKALKNASAFRDVFLEYERIKAHLHKIDFDDMLLMCYRLLSSDKELLRYWQGKYKFILIDEFQDINFIQFETVKMLASPHNNIFVVGDDDQSIYKFRGARPDFLLGFSNEFKGSGTVTLQTNYRSTEKIISISNTIIGKNINRYRKRMTGKGEAGAAPILIMSDNIKAEADAIASKIAEKSGIEGEIAVVYRTHMQSCAIIDSFFTHNIPFVVNDESPSIYSHFIAKDICAYIKLAYNKYDNSSFMRIYHKPMRMLSKTQVENAISSGGSAIENLMSSGGLSKIQFNRLSELCVYLNGIRKRNAYEAFKFIREAAGYNEYLAEYAKYNGAIDGYDEIADELLESARGFETPLEYVGHVEQTLERLKQKSEGNRHNKNKISHKGMVVLSTIHGVKGLEFDTVFVSTAIDGVIPHSRSVKADEIEEERRIFYVALTRAKKYLYISAVKNRYGKKVNLTPFIECVLK